MFIPVENPWSGLKLQKFRVILVCPSLLDKVVSGFLKTNGAWEDRVNLSPFPPFSSLQEGNINTYIGHTSKQEAQ